MGMGNALLQVFGGAAEGGGEAFSENARFRMQEKATKLRDENLARLRETGAQSQHQRDIALEDRRSMNEAGLLEEQRGYDEGAIDREIEALMAQGYSEEDAKKKVVGKAYPSTTSKSDWEGPKLRRQLMKDYLDVNVPEGMQATEEDISAAEAYADRALGVQRKKAKTEEGEPAEKVSTLEQFRAKLKEVQDEGRVSEGEGTAVADAEERPGAGFGAGVGAFGDSIKSSLSGKLKAVEKWAAGRRKRFEEGGNLSDEAIARRKAERRGKKPAEGEDMSPFAPSSAMAEEAPETTTRGLLQQKPEAAESKEDMVPLKNIKYNGNTVYNKGMDYYVEEKGGLRKLTEQEVVELEDAYLNRNRE